MIMTVVIINKELNDNHNNDNNLTTTTASVPSSTRPPPPQPPPPALTSTSFRITRTAAIVSTQLFRIVRGCLQLVQVSNSPTKILFRAFYVRFYNRIYY